MKDEDASFTKAQELRSFLFLSVVMAPVISGRNRGRLRFPRLDVSTRCRTAGKLNTLSKFGMNTHMQSVLRGKEGGLEELHITSLVVHAAPKRVNDVSDAIAAMPGARIHAASCSGKLIVTLEASTAAEMLSRITAIQRADGVLSAAMVYQCVDTLEAMNEEILDADA